MYRLHISIAHVIAHVVKNVQFYIFFLFVELTGIPTVYMCYSQGGIAFGKFSVALYYFEITHKYLCFCQRIKINLLLIC